MQAGDVLATIADIGDLERAVGVRPRILVEDGVAKFVAWYKDYFQAGSAGARGWIQWCAAIRMRSGSFTNQLRGSQ